MSKTILIADDDPSIVVSLEYLMGRNGYQVKIARNGEEAIASIDAFQPDLVLLDLMLPLKNGFEVCQRIRETPDRRNTRVVMLTAKGRDIDITRGLALGAVAYVTKPFSTKDLMATVHKLLGDA